MNRAYKLVWNAVSNSWVVASELAKSGKKSSVKKSAGKALKLAVLLASGLTASMANAAPAANALPTGESVQTGSATFDRTVTNQLTVNQSTAYGYTTWQDFNVGKDAKVVINQPSSSSYSFNQVTTATASEVFGRVESNGHFILSNPAGITFGAGSQVNAAAIVATVHPSVLVSSGNSYVVGLPTAGATVENYGTLTATAGSVTLLAPRVINAGTIHAVGGNVNLINANSVGFSNANPTINSVSRITGFIQNSGNITATQVSSVGGKILLTGDTSQTGSSIALTGTLTANQTEVNARQINVAGILDIDGASNLLKLNSSDGYTLSSGSKINLNGAGSGFSVNGTSYTVIRNIDQLQATGSSSDSRYVLAGDIDASDTVNWNSGAGFNPLSLFNSVLDGLGHNISQLFINRPNTESVGLVGTANYSSIRNIGLIGSNISGASYVGGLAGAAGASSISNSYNTGTVNGNTFVGGLVGQFYAFNANETASISNSYNTGTISASGSIGSDGAFTGGLVGEMYAGFSNNLVTISNSYNTGAVSSNSSNMATYTGGLAGRARAYFNSSNIIISNSYSTGTVSSSSSNFDNAYAGGLVGSLTASFGNSSVSLDNSYSTGAVSTSVSGFGGAYAGGLVGELGAYYDAAQAYLNNSYWDTQTSGQASAVGVSDGAQTQLNLTGLSTTQALSQSNYSNFDFSNTWFIADGSSRPLLRAFLNTADADGRIAISNLYQLQGMAANLAGNYYLTQGIDAAATAASVTAGNASNRADVWAGYGFSPIGKDNSGFTGVLDGQGYSISGLNINRGSSDYVGLIGYAQNSSIHDVGLTNANISGANATAALLGLSAGSTLTNNYASGVVTGQNYVGGLVGYNADNSAISNSYATASVSGTSAGGLVGYNFNGYISNSYASGSVTGGSNVGGLLGQNFGSVSNSYASGSVSGSRAGGLVGLNAGNISNSYASGAVTGTATGGLTGIFNNIGNVSNSYWNIASTGQAVSQSGTGLTDAQMKNASSFAGWDISATGGSASIWRIYEGQSSPLLRSFLKQVNVTIGSDNKTYDGTAYHVTGGSYTLSDPAASLLGSISYGSGTAEGAYNAGTYSLTGEGLYSSQQGYDISYTDGTLTINKAALSITSGNVTKTYDATTNAAGSAVVSSGSLYGSDSISGGTFAFTDKNAGTGKTVAVAGVTINDGNNGGNYDVTYVDNTNSTINKRLLTITAAADSKVYDGKLTSSATAKPVVVGRQRGDAIVGLTQSYTDKNAGTGKTINVDGGYTIRDGNNGDNYTVVLVSNYNGVITPKALTISTVANSKVYDGGLTSANKPIVSGLITGDRVTGLFQQYETKTVGGDKKMIVKAGYVVQDGNSGGNYTVTEQASNDGVITAH